MQLEKRMRLKPKSTRIADLEAKIEAERIATKQAEDVLDSS